MAALVVTVALVPVLPATAAAPATPLGLTTAQAQSALLQPGTIIQSVTAVGGDTLVRTGLAGDDVVYAGFKPTVSAANCTPLGKPLSANAYVAFRCDVRWTAPSGISRTLHHASFWVRPVPWQTSYGAFKSLICASTRTLADCAPPPPPLALPGDPRVCSTDCSPSKEIGNLGFLASDAALAKLRTQGKVAIPNFGCLAQSAFVYRCTSMGTTLLATVRFVQGKTGWSTTVTPA